MRSGVGGTGGGGGPKLMVRADMDALPVLERGGDRVVTPEIDGVMHACGHDGHVAMTLGAGAARLMSATLVIPPPGFVGFSTEQTYRGWLIKEAVGADQFQSTLS